MTSQQLERIGAAYLAEREALGQYRAQRYQAEIAKRELREREASLALLCGDADHSDIVQSACVRVDPPASECRLNGR